MYCAIIKKKFRRATTFPRILCFLRACAELGGGRAESRVGGGAALVAPARALSRLSGTRSVPPIHAVSDPTVPLNQPPSSKNER